MILQPKCSGYKLIEQKSLRCEMLHRSDSATRRTAWLGQVVAEGGHEHVVDSVRIYKRSRRAASSPSISDEVGILRAELYPSFWTVIWLDPESERAFDSALGLAAATAKPTKTESGSR